jgi:hypothetical protein
MPMNPDRRSVLAGLAALPALTAAPAWSQPQTRPFNLRIVMSGHSLTDPIPVPLDMIVKAAGGAESRGMLIDQSTIPGSPSEHRWKTDPIEPIDAKRDIANYDLLVLTERVPVRPTLKFHNSDTIALKWFEHAWKNGRGGKGAETIYYASWISVVSGPGSKDDWDDQWERETPYRERLDLEMVAWQTIIDYVNTNRSAGSPPMRAIPGPKIMAAVYDAIQAGTAPGLTKMQDLFADTIHPNEMGTYLICAAHFAVIYGRDPREIPNLRGKPGWPNTEQQEWMKALVWDVCRAYPDSGLA